MSGSPRIPIKVVRGKTGKYLLRWKQGGRWRERTTDLQATPANRRQAILLTAQLEQELRGESAPQLLIPAKQRAYEFDPDQDRPPTHWHEFQRYCWATHFKTISPGYANGLKTVLLNFSIFSGIQQLAEITPSLCRRWVAHLSDSGLAVASIHSYWRHLSATLAIAVDDGLLASVPKIRLPKRVTGSLAKGRALTDSEVAQFIKTAKEERGQLWADLVEGLWLSGLRIGEAYRLTWHHSGFWVEMAVWPPLYHITEQKNKQRQTLPVVPEFAPWLQKRQQAYGFVFQLPGAVAERVGLENCVRYISDIGEAAGIRTGPDKHATAHDLRRSFATRWAAKVLPQHLKQLMRHANITTTLAYYADIRTTELTEAIYPQVGDKGGNGEGSESEAPQK